MIHRSALILISIKAIAGHEVLKKLVGEIKNITWNFVFSSVYRRFETDQRYDFDANMVAVAKLSVSFDSKELAEKVRHMESYLESFVGPERVNITLLAYEKESLMTPELTLPQPSLHLDPLVTRCAAEVWGNYEHPILKKSLNDLARLAPPILNAEFMLQGKSLVST